MMALKDLISGEEGDPRLYDGSAEELVHFDKVLNNKHVGLFISDLRIKPYISKMKKIYEGIMTTDVVTIWLPVVRWSDDGEKLFFYWRNEMKWYTVMYFSPLAGLKTIKEEWKFVGAPLVVVMNRQGDELSKNRLDKLPPFSDVKKEEKFVAPLTKLLLQKPDGKITEVLKALLGKDSLRLLDGCSTKKEVKHLKDKHVLLFISCLDKKYYAIEQIKAVYAGIAKDLVNVVLILMGEESIEEVPQKLKELQSDKICYRVQSDLPKAGIDLIEERWKFRKSPIVVMMNPKGEVLSFHKFKLESIEPLPRPQQEKHVYSLHWGGSFFNWNERFYRIAKAVAADKVLKAANVCIELRPDNSNPPGNYQNTRTKRALLKKKQKIICEGPKILNVLEAFDKWKGNLALEPLRKENSAREPFEICFEAYFNELTSK